MRQYIKKLQSKNEDTRKLIMVGSLIVCMALVSFIWIYNLGTRFGDPKVATQTNEDIKPFKLFSNSLSDTYKNISASVGKAKISDEAQKDTEVKEENKVDLIPVEYNNQ
ncbi:hypothetical protein HXX01_05420 [Candidatus Nomurabacteria bacterium]|nr:hypothetical protein [Candidatus Nomurabacteria bacterium]